MRNEFGFNCRARVLPFVLVFSVLSAFSPPALACICSCEHVGTQGSEAFNEAVGQYEQVFAGLVISAERTYRPVNGATSSGRTVEVEYWTKSRIVVTRIWRGAPPAIAEVWTLSGSSCHLDVVAGLYFVALASTDNGRSVADNLDCECGVEEAATKGKGTYTKAGVALTAVTSCAAATVLIWFGLAIWRLRRLEGSRQHLPFALCFVALALPVSIFIYLTAFQSAIAAIASLVILLLGSKVLMHFSVSDAWRRNAGWLLASVVSVFAINFIAFVTDDSFSEMESVSPLTDPFLWVFVAVGAALTLILLYSFRYFQRVGK